MARANEIDHPRGGGRLRGSNIGPAPEWRKHLGEGPELHERGRVEVQVVRRDLDEDAGGCLRLRRRDDLEATGRRDLPGDHVRAGRVARLNQLRETERLTDCRPTLREGWEIRASSLAEAVKRRVDHRLVSSKHADASPERCRLR